MRRGSFGRRLPRGGRGLKASPAMLGAAVFLILLVPTIFYLFPHAPTLQASVSPSPLSSPTADNDKNGYAAKEGIASDPILKVASVEASLEAMINSSSDFTEVHLKNTGSVELHHVVVQNLGKTLGVLSKLDPGEKKILALSGQVSGLKVLALDPSNREITGRMLQDPATASSAIAIPSSQNVALNTKSATKEPVLCASSSEGASSEAASVSPTSAIAPSVSPAPKKSASSPLTLTIASDKSDGRKGEVIAYRCTAKNSGTAELSSVRLFCGDKMASTMFLPPGEEINLDGSLVLENNTRLLAGVDAMDANETVYSNNSTMDIWMISPEIEMLLNVPDEIHRGEKVAIQVQIKNNGRENLSNIRVLDGFGEIGSMASLGPGISRFLQKERVISESVSSEVQIFALDSRGKDIYASQRLNIRVRASSLQIQGEPAEVRTYPGKPAEVTWVLCNTGEEPLKNITLDGDGKKCVLKELPAGRSMRMAAIYNKVTTSFINVTAKGIDSGGFAVQANGSVLIRTVQPGIGLKVMPPEMEVCPGDTAKLSVLVTNTGDDALSDVQLRQNGSTLASIGRLESGEFRVVESLTAIPASTTLHFQASGVDSRGQIWSDEASSRIKASVTSLKIFVSSSPPVVTSGASATLTCTVANTGSVPLYSIFILSETLGPLGNIDYVSPKHQMMVSIKSPIIENVDETITAEGFTQDKTPVTGTCRLKIGLLSTNDKAHVPESLPVGVVAANLSCGNMSLPFGLPSEEDSISRVSGKVANDVERVSVKSNNIVLDGFANLLRYVEKLLGVNNNDIVPQTVAPQGLSEGRERSLDGKDYELSIEGVKGSEHGAITILDVSAMPSQPAAGEPVKVTVHLQSISPVVSASVKYGLSELPLTKQDMLGVDRVYDSPMTLESGSALDGYWSSTIPGRGGGVYLVMSVWMTDGSNKAEGGPYMLHWSTVNSAPGMTRSTVISPASGQGMLFIESSTVKGRGEVSIKDTFQGASLNYNEKMIGKGSINLETLRCIDRKTSVDNFTEKKDLVFTDGNLKGRQTLESPTFHGGMGASVTERFNLSHVDKSESSSVSSASSFNNTLAFKSEQAFNGTWNIQTKYAKFYKKIKADQQYTGSFQTQKDIKFQDAGQK
ncbi:Uncharacterised protein [uncultured archaeon]|nr:Uncharacterised protein [uncultured archaeon]